MSDRVVGNCPMGCGETLRRDQFGHVVCSALECPTPTAVNAILLERETEHIVVFSESSFIIQHPLRERIDGGLFRCALLAYCSALPGPPTAPGRYRALEQGGEWRFSRVSDQPEDSDG